MSYYDEAVMMTYQLGRWSGDAGRDGALGHAPGTPLGTPLGRPLGMRRLMRPRPLSPVPWSFLRLVP
ncbi:MAG: hypothetical protein AAFP17_16240 [Pseudomonadota bacterium]